MGNELSQARARIDSLLDANSFVELQALVTSRSTDFNLDAAKEPSDGVIIGHGLIDGSLVFVFSQDASVLGGTIGEMHAKKILSVYDMALKVGAPVIGMLDCAGVRLQESYDALEAMGQVIRKAADVKGVIPQIMCVCGNCGGGLAVLPALADFAFMTESASLFINSPDAICGNRADVNDSSSAAFQAEAGTVDFVGDEAAVFAKVKEVIAMVEDTADCTDDLNRAAEGLEDKINDAAKVAAELADNRQFVELKADYAKCMVTGLMKLDGITVGVIGNRETEDGAVVCAKGARKAADFVDFCDMYDLPILTITNIAGFEASLCTEKNLPRALAELTQSLCDASVPKINLITKQAFGSAYVLLNSKAMGADFVYALDTASIGAMPADKAAKIICGDDTANLASVEAEYAALQASAVNAARRGYVDRILACADARKYVISGIEMFYRG